MATNSPIVALTSAMIGRASALSTLRNAPTRIKALLTVPSTDFSHHTGLVSKVYSSLITTISSYTRRRSSHKSLMSNPVLIPQPGDPPNHLQNGLPPSTPILEQPAVDAYSTFVASKFPLTKHPAWHAFIKLLVTTFLALIPGMLLWFVVDHANLIPLSRPTSGSTTVDPFLRELFRWSVVVGHRMFLLLCHSGDSTFVTYKRLQSLPPDTSPIQTQYGHVGTLWVWIKANPWFETIRGHSHQSPLHVRSIVCISCT